MLGQRQQLDQSSSSQQTNKIEIVQGEGDFMLPVPEEKEKKKPETNFLAQ